MVRYCWNCLVYAILLELPSRCDIAETAWSVVQYCWNCLVGGTILLELPGRYNIAGTAWSVVQYCCNCLVGGTILLELPSWCVIARFLSGAGPSLLYQVLQEHYRAPQSIEATTILEQRKSRTATLQTETWQTTTLHMHIVRCNCCRDSDGSSITLQIETSHKAAWKTATWETAIWKTSPGRQQPG